MDLTLSFNKRYIDKDISKINYGWENEKVSIDKLISYIEQGIGYCGGVILPEVTDKKKPAKINLDYSEILCLDFDNDNDKVKYFSVEDALNDDIIKNNGILLHETTRSTSQKNRFRVLILLDKPCGKDEYELIASYFIKKYNTDSACKDYSKVYAGNSKVKCIKLGAKRLNTQAIIDLVDIAQEPVNEFKNYEQEDLTIDQARGMLSYIPTKQSYDEWYSVCKDLLDYFGLNEGSRLIQGWSPCIQQGKEATYEWSKKIDISRIEFPKVLYSFAKRGGWIDERKRKIPVKANEKKKLSPTLKKIYAIEKYLKNVGRFTFNIVKSRGEYKLKNTEIIKPLEDYDVNGFWREISETGIEGITVSMINTILDSPFSPKVDPILDFFKNLPKWDGVNRIEQVSECIPVEESHKRMRNDYVKRWIVGMVAQATLRGRNHLCLTLVGEQGYYKNTFFKTIIPNELREEYFTERRMNPENDDDIKLMTNTILIMMDELETQTKKDMGGLKSLMTQEIFNMRLSYGRRHMVLKRRASFCGGVNRSEFLNDITGNRRFIVIELTDSIDIGILEDIDLLQMYAEAWHLLNTGFRYWYQGEEIKIINERNKDFNVPSQEEEAIQHCFDVTEKDDEFAVFLTATEIGIYILEKTKVKLYGNHTGRAMTNLGFKKSAHAGKRGYWVKIKQLKNQENNQVETKWWVN